MKKTTLGLALGTLLAMTSQQAHAALIAGWDFQTTANGGTATAAATSTPTSYLANVGTQAGVAGMYLDGTNGSSTWLQASQLNAFTGTNVNTSGTGLSTVTSGAASLALVNQTANGQFVTFKFDMTGFNTLDVSYASQRTGTGFNSQVWEYSTDGATWSAAGTNSSIPAAFGVLSIPTISALASDPTVWLRLTVTGASAAAGNNRLDNIQFNAFAAPAAGEYWDTNGGSGGLGGSGNWNTTDTNWNDSTGTGTPSTFTSTQGAIFSGTAGTVTISPAAITVNGGTTFSSDGYIVTGNTLNIGTTNTVNVTNASDTATINSVVGGSTGLAKGGAGTLVLGASGNTFTGNVSISNGALSISADGNLGATANDIALGGGTLKATSTVSLDSGRDLSGFGGLDVANGSTLTVNGSAATSAISLTNSGIVVLAGGTKSTGAVTFAAPGTLRGGSGADTITVAGNLVSTNSSGTATFDANADFGSTARSVTTVAGGTLTIDGDIAINQRISYTGAGTVNLLGSVSGTNSATTLGTSGAAGPTLKVGNANTLGAAAAAQLRFNSGTLQATAPVTFASNVTPSFGSEAGFASTFAGSAITFNGNVSLFKPTGYSDPLQLTVNNATTFAGGWGASTGTGTSNALTLTGTGTLTLAGSIALDMATTTVDGLTLVVNGSFTSPTAALVTANGGTIKGTGTLSSLTVASGTTVAPGNSIGTLNTGTLNMQTGSLYDFEFGVGNDLIAVTAGLTIGGGGFNLYADGTTNPFSTPGLYTLVTYGTFTGDEDLLSVLNPVSGYVYDFIDTGSSIQLSITAQVVPEPSSLLLLLMGAVALLQGKRRR